jgi:hypothetical protein
MTPNRPHSTGSARHATPLALMFKSRLLLTEKSSVTIQSLSAVERTETRIARAALLTAFYNVDPTYSHYGIND